MELELRNGDYVSDGAGGLRRLEGDQALLQRVLFRLKAHRGSFPFWDGLGSRLWQLGCLPARERQAAAKQYVTEALARDGPAGGVNRIDGAWRRQRAPDGGADLSGRAADGHTGNRRMRGGSR